MSDPQAIDNTIGEIVREYMRAATMFPAFNSAHEGYAVLLEEVEELKYEVFHGTPERGREEAIQVGAMALRFILDMDVKGGVR